MTPNALLQLGLFCILLLAVTKPLGEYMARVYDDQARWAGRLLGPGRGHDAPERDDGKDECARTQH